MYRERLVQFEKAVAQKLYKSGLIDNINNYFNEEDEADIMSWDEMEAKKIYNKICEWANNKLRVGGLRVGYSPFCLYVKRNCNKCGFGKRHGECGDDESIMGKIDKKFMIENTDNILTQSFYKNVIRQIEEMIK